MKRIMQKWSFSLEEMKCTPNCMGLKVEIAEQKTDLRKEQPQHTHAHTQSCPRLFSGAESLEAGTWPRMLERVRPRGGEQVLPARTAV